MIKNLQTADVSDDLRMFPYSLDESEYCNMMSRFIRGTQKQKSRVFDVNVHMRHDID